MSFCDVLKTLAPFHKLLAKLSQNTNEGKQGEEELKKLVFTEREREISNIQCSYITNKSALLSML